MKNLFCELACLAGQLRQMASTQRLQNLPATSFTSDHKQQIYMIYMINLNIHKAQSSVPQTEQPMRHC